MEVCGVFFEVLVCLMAVQWELRHTMKPMESMVLEVSSLVSERTLFNLEERVLNKSKEDKVSVMM